MMLHVQCPETGCQGGQAIIYIYIFLSIVKAAGFPILLLKVLIHEGCNPVPLKTMAKFYTQGG